MIQIVVLKWFIQTGLSKNGTWVLKINIIKHSTWQNDLSRTYTWSVNKVIRNRRPSVYDELLLDEETCCYLWQMLARRPCSAVVWQLEHVSKFPDSGVYVHVYAKYMTWYILMIWIPNHPYSACPCWLDYFGSSKISCAIISNHGSGAPVWATVNGQLLFSKKDKPSFVIEREWANWRRLVLELPRLRQLQRLWAQLGHWLNRLPVPNKTRPGLKKIHEEWLRAAQWQVRQHCWRLMGRSKDWDSENRSWLVWWTTATRRALQRELRKVWLGFKAYRGSERAPQCIEVKGAGALGRQQRWKARSLWWWFGEVFAVAKQGHELFVQHQKGKWLRKRESRM